MAMITIALKKAIQAHGKEIDEITLRPPEPTDVMEEGVPSLLIPSADGKSVGIEVRAKVVGRYISRLGSIPMSSVKAMSFGDFNRCMNAVMGFFGDGDGEESSNSPTESSTSPDSGD
jgi:hypothetical protein